MSYRYQNKQNNQQQIHNNNLEYGNMNNGNNQMNDQGFRSVGQQNSVDRDYRQKWQVGYNQNYYDQYWSIFSRDGAERESRSVEYNGVGGIQYGNGTVQMLSISDLIKTNCSHTHKQISYIGNIQKGSTNRSSKQLTPNYQQYEYDIQLQPVSNRKLQNRLNSRRARERKKIEYQKMKEFIEELKNQNKYLKNMYIGRNGGGGNGAGRGNVIVNGKMGNEENERNIGRVGSMNREIGFRNERNESQGHGRTMGSRWRYCQKCNKQLFYKNTQPSQQMDLQPQNQQQIVTSKQLLLPKIPQKFIVSRTQPKNTKYIKFQVISDKKEYKTTQDKYFPQLQRERLQGNNKNKGVENQAGKQFKLDEQLQFQEIDFGLLSVKNDKQRKYEDKYNEKYSEKYEQKYEQKYDVKFQYEQDRKNKKNKIKVHNRNWTAKIWIALSILMMVIGLQMHGLQGSGQKQIRINQKQAKKWLQDYKNPNKQHLQISMKTDISTKQKPHKQSQYPQFPQIKFQSQQAYLSQKHKSKHKSDKSQLLIRQRFPFSSSNKDAEYDQGEGDEEEESFSIDKDLLMSIHAQLDDIGRYV